MHHLIRKLYNEGLNGVEAAVDAIAKHGKTAGARKLIDMDRRVNKLLREGTNDATLTPADIFRAQLGTNSPNGLDIQHWPSGRTVEITDFDNSSFYQQLGVIDKMREKRAVDGRGGADGIALRDMPRGGLGALFDAVGSSRFKRCSTLGHEMVHVMQHDPAYGWDMYMDNHMGEALSKDLSGHFIRRAVAGAIERLNHARIELANFLKGTATVGNYFASDAEMQARLHEILIQGHAVWDAMPADKTELHAALYNLGVKMPQHIENELRDSEAGQQALHKFDAADPNLELRTGIKVSELNRVYDYATTPEKRAAIANDVYPALYGELIEYYGDTQGRARMNLGTNPQPVRNALASLRNDTGQEISQDTQTAFRNIPPELAVDAINKLIVTLDVTTKNDPEITARAEMAIQDFFARSEIGDKLENFSIEGNELQHKLPPLLHAMQMGHTGIVRGMLNAGLEKDSEMFAGIYTSSGKHMSFLDMHITTQDMLEEYDNDTLTSKQQRKMLQDPDLRKAIESTLEKQKTAITELTPEIMESARCKLDDEGIKDLRNKLMNIGIDPKTAPATPDNYSSYKHQMQQPKSRPRSGAPGL